MLKGRSTLGLTCSYHVVISGLGVFNPFTVCFLLTKVMCYIFVTQKCLVCSKGAIWRRQEAKMGMERNPRQKEKREFEREVVGG